MNWFKQIITGADNQTVAIGRVVGLILLIMAVLQPIAELVTVARKMFGVDQWGSMLAQWQVFVPVMVGTAAGTIAGTAFTEPKKNGNGNG